MDASPVTVVVVDDHPFFRDGISRGLAREPGVRVVGEAGSGREGVELITELRPDAAVVDYRMPDLNGIELIQALRRAELGTRVLVLSAETDASLVFAALEAGANGYLSKDATRQEIVDAVLRVARGATVVPPELLAGVADQIRMRADQRVPALSERELAVLRGFARGLSVPQLAAELSLAPTTVKTHTQRLYEKLGVSDRAAAVAAGMRLKLLE